MKLKTMSLKGQGHFDVMVKLQFHSQPADGPCGGPRTENPGLFLCWGVDDARYLGELNSRGITSLTC